MSKAENYANAIKQARAFAPGTFRYKTSLSDSSWAAHVKEDGGLELRGVELSLADAKRFLAWMIDVYDDDSEQLTTTDSR